MNVHTTPSLMVTVDDTVAVAWPFDIQKPNTVATGSIPQTKINFQTLALIQAQPRFSINALVSFGGIPLTPSALT
jgi:hypothetical protein